MRVPVLAAVSLACFSSAVAAPRHWTWERGQPQGNNLTDIAVGSAASLPTFGVGDYGSIVHYDTGNGWTVQPSGVTANLKGVALATTSGTTAFAVGDGATLLKTTNGGTSWTPVTCSGCGNLTSVAFKPGASLSAGVIAGTGGIRYTTDGTTFTLATTGSVTTITRLAWSQAAGSNVVYGMTANGTVYKSTDGGQNWTVATSPNSGTTWYGLSVPTDAAVFVSGKAAMSQSTTSGASWSAVSLPTTITSPTVPFSVFGVSMTSATAGYAVAGHVQGSGFIANTQWKLLSCSNTACSEVSIGTQKTDVFPKAISALAGPTYFIAGEGGMLYHVVNNGSLINDGNATGQRYFDVDWVDATTQVASGAEGAISLGLNGVWTEFYPAGATTDLQSIAAGSSAVVAVGNSGANFHASTAALNSFTTGAGFNTTTHQRAVAYLTGQTFVSGGDDGILHVTTDNGANWTTVDPDATATGGVTSIVRRPMPTDGGVNDVWVGTGGMKLYKSSAPASVWYDVTASFKTNPAGLVPAGIFVMDMSWLDATTGFLVVSTGSYGAGGGYAYVFQTTDSGGQWTKIYNATGSGEFCNYSGWTKIFAHSATSLWLQGETCFAHLTFNGTTWSSTPEAIPYGQAMLGLGGHGPGEMWMVGNFGAVLHSRCGGSDTSTCAPDSNTCTDDSCNPADGVCLHTPNVANTCTDGNACTSADHCASDGSCQGTAKVCNDNNSCTNDSCNTVDAGCIFTVNTANTCSDGDGCTQTDSCQADGGCKGSNPVTCSPSTGCATFSCYSPTGLCVQSNAQATVMCNDGLSCTGNDSCDGQGHCVGTSTCTPPSVCQVATCQADGGCGFTPVVGVVACDDGNPCTVNDLCNGGVCVGSGSCGGDGGSGGGTGGGAGGGSGGGSGGGTGGGATGGGTGGSATGGGTGGGSSGTDGGTGPTPIFQPGCACNTGSPTDVFSLFVAFLGVARGLRRRR